MSDVCLELVNCWASDDARLGSGVAERSDCTGEFSDLPHQIMA